VLAIIVVVILNIFPQVAQKNSLLKMAAGRLDVKKVAYDLAGTRFVTWKITLQEIRDRPILGWGPENFYVGFEKYYSPAIIGVKNEWWDRPHNILLEIAVNSGIISAVLYVFFWIILLWQLQKFKKKQPEAREIYLAHAIQAMFMGYLVSLFFNFDSFSTYIISFFFIGYTFYLLSGQEKKEIVPNPKSFFSEKVVPAAVIYFILVVLFLFAWNIKPLFLNEELIYANGLVNMQNCDSAVAIADGAWKSGGILMPYSALKYSDFLEKCVFLQPNKQVDYASSGLQALKTGSSLQPEYTRTWLLMGGFANVLAAREQNQDNQNKLLSDSLDYLKKTIKISPGRLEIIIEFEKNYIIAKNYQAMEKTANDCIKIDSSNGQCYWYLGIAEIFLGDQVNGKKHIQESKEKSSITPPYI